jgi:hypothetical protein
MIITQEVADRLKNNLMFDKTDITGAQGAIQILFKNESQESIEGLYALLRSIAEGADALVGLEVPDKDFSGSMEYQDQKPSNT